MERLFLLMVVALLGACAGTPPSASFAPSAQPASELLHDSAFAPAPEVQAGEDVFALNPAMKQYLRSTAADALRRRGPLHGLVDALYSKKDLQIEYDAERTRTAAEAFDARAGNCLSLVLMTAAFAKELGLHVRYQLVEAPAVWDRSAGLVMRIGHVNVSLGRPVPLVHFTSNFPEWLTVDFMPSPDSRRLRASPIEERRLLSMYAANRAAESLVAGHIDAAYGWARAAVLHDSEHADAYNTLAVVYQRHGDSAWAEAALRQALALQADHLHAMGNLAALLQGQRREAEAQAWSARLKRLQPNPPFQHFDAGMQALRAGDYAKARDLLERDEPRVNGFHELHFGLALAYLNLGDSGAAERHLKLARDHSVTRQQQALYAAKLGHLKTITTTP